MTFLVGSGRSGLSRSSSSPVVKRNSTSSPFEKDLSEGSTTSHTVSETEFNGDMADISDVLEDSTATLGVANSGGNSDLDASRHGMMQDISTKSEAAECPPPTRSSSSGGNRRGSMMKGMWSSMRSFRSSRRASVESLNALDDSLHNNNNNSAHGGTQRPKLPIRQATFETARGSTIEASSGADQVSLQGSFANLEIDCVHVIDEGTPQNEECVELQEKIEALERKLETKQAVLMSLLPPSSDDDTLSHEDRLKLKIQEQALRIEELEEEQYQRDCTMIEEEHVGVNNNTSSNSSIQYWEQIQEQQETITRMESDYQYQRQMQMKREKQLQDMLAQIQAEKQKMQEAHEQQLQTLQAQLAQTQQDAEGYREQACDLREMVTDMEQTNEEQIHLLKIAMSSIEDSLGEQF